MEKRRCRRAARFFHLRAKCGQTVWTVSAKLMVYLVDLIGIEPMTSSMPWKRAPSCATGPRAEGCNSFIVPCQERFVNLAGGGARCAGQRGTDGEHP